MSRTFVILIFLTAILAQSGFLALRSVLAVVAHKTAMKEQFKSELRRGMHPEKQCSFSESQLKTAEWEHSREFFLGDDKYDVLRIEYKAGVKYFVCFKDDKELELLAEMDKSNQDDDLLEDLSKKIQLGYENMPEFLSPSISQKRFFHDPDKAELLSAIVCLFKPPIS